MLLLGLQLLSCSSVLTRPGDSAVGHRFAAPTHVDARRAFERLDGMDPAPELWPASVGHVSLALCYNDPWH